jgi:agmatine/peptidylarginine deiminase
MEKGKIRFPAEWEEQSAVQLTWPHKDTDWASELNEVTACFTAIAKEIIKREKLLIVCRDRETVRRQLGDIDGSRIIFAEIPANDTWARDHGGIAVFIDGKPCLYEFVFNGWGLKFPAGYDNQITRRLFSLSVFSEETALVSKKPFVLEGGSLETDGKGSLLTTLSCLTSVNRNEHLDKGQIECFLKDIFGLRRVLWLENGYLAGDDTDGHIDMLARFCSEDTIAYACCCAGIEEELKRFVQENGAPYRLIPLPSADRAEWKGKRLPATYANFLIINGAVLLPFYRSPKDKEAKAALRQAFPDREIIGVDCLPLIKQGGSLHCVTMHFPKGFIP